MNRIEEELKTLMLQDVSFIVDDKVIKRGRIKIYNTKHNFIKFKLESGGETKEWELTYPFKIEKLQKGYLFNYCLSAFCPRTETAFWKMKMMDKSESSKIHDNHLFVIPN
jgi:hypothetical protein